MTYEEFVQNKKIKTEEYGFEPDEIHSALYDFQRDITSWALRKGKCAVFTMTGTGKTIMQTEWAKQVHNKTGGNVLILAPLAVSNQTVREAHKIGLDITLCRTQADVRPGVNITNYEMLHHFDEKEFVGVVLDESSILKAFDGKTRTQIINKFGNTPYRLACTATPAPNDYMELGNHAEFLGVMNRTEMLAMFFVHDGGETQKWRLKGHAQKDFWEWVASWACVLTKPSDLGYEDNGFDLPKLNIYEHVVESAKQKYTLFAVPASTLQERQQAKRDSLVERVDRCVDIIGREPRDKWLIWCNLNIEQDLLKKKFGSAALSIQGSTPNDQKVELEKEWREGNVPILITKPSVFGYGMNWQHCRNMAFVGISDSFEQYFQAVRRCWRFGQTQPVQAHLIISEEEGAIKLNITRKEKDAIRMIERMVEYTKNITRSNIQKTKRDSTKYNPSVEMITPEWLKEENAYASA